MRNVLKLLSLTICAASLTGCAFSNSVLQGAYDEQADKPCERAAGSSDSIHRRGCEKYDGLVPDKPKKKWENQGEK